ncbi:MAG: TRAP transporter small permease subunit [Pseudomonadales bacterium]|nr:TRAP transporter small permease subunit [Pseudomonadales bacterium]NRA18272.1 TRAP transporter small permease subunit [Oceanospirillaceae bacterium]
MQLSSKLGLLIHLVVEKLCLYLLAVLVSCEIVIVLLRYIYGIGYLQLQDLALYSFSVLVVLSIVYGFGRNEHVRVDVFRERQGQRLQQQIDAAAILLLMIPFFALTLYWVWPDISYAWKITEGSRETGGLPGLFLVKTSLPLVCSLMIIQGVVVLVRGGRYLPSESAAAADSTGGEA